jgi:ring-1,2-phenylacetyl-CoA epoxidase subunit PaaE
MFYKLKIADIERLTPDSVCISLAIPTEDQESFRFVPGQYLTLEQEIQGEQVRRSYSICSDPSSDVIQVGIKKITGGLFSSFANDELQAGDTLQVMAPQGKFTHIIDPKADNNYVAICAGSGITPILSIIKTVLTQEPDSSFTLFYGNKKTDTIMFRENLNELKDTYIGRFSFYNVLSKESQTSPILNGRIDTEKLATYCKIFFNPKTIDSYFLCGPYQLIMDTQEFLLEKGVAKEKIKFELFTTEGIVKKEVQSKEEKDMFLAEVKIKLDGSEFVFQSESDINVLDEAIRNGGDLPYSCKGGVCSTCRAKLIEGEVEMELQYALDDEEIEQGFILTCQAIPKSKKLFIDFDAD